MLKRLFPLCIIIFLSSHIAAAQDATLYVPMNFPIEIDPATYTNPFDSSDIELLGIFESPSGRELVIPGFWMQPYSGGCATCDTANLEPDGEPTWQVRFTPQEIGTWSYRLEVRDNGAVIETREGQFDVAESDRRGFVRVGANKRYFRFENGESYFPIGHNLGWSWDGGGGVRVYQNWLRELSAAGGNYARLNIDVPWFINLEWQGAAGNYREAQEQAAALDLILDTAAEYGIQLQLILLWHQSLLIYNGPPVLIPENPPRPNTNTDWDAHPYNIVNGGPLSGPAVFFFDETAQNLIRRRLEYIVARWGYSPQIFAWELIDEIDRTTGYDQLAAGQWLQTNVSYLRQLDQQGHLITAGSEAFDTLVAGSALLDFTTGQFYWRRPIEEAGDQVAGVLDTIRQRLQVNPVPTLLTDFSLNPWFEPTADDPEGIHVQMTLWASALSGAGGSAFSSWWDTYVIAQGLERYYPALSAFTAGVDWGALDLQPAQAGLVAADSAAYAPVRIQEFNRTFAAQVGDAVLHEVTADGVFPPVSGMSSYLYGQTFNTRFTQPQLYRSAPPFDTYLEIGVSGVSTQAGARLVVTVDDLKALELELNPGSGGMAVQVPLPAGEHTIRLDNLGDDWLEVSYIEIGQLVSPVRVLTLRDSTAGVALSWLQHREYTWQTATAERQPLLFQYRLNQMPPGRYVTEIWNPLTGAVIGEELVSVDDDGVLAFDLLPMDSQLAIRAFRRPDS